MKRRKTSSVFAIIIAICTIVSCTQTDYIDEYTHQELLPKEQQNLFTVYLSNELDMTDTISTRYELMDTLLQSNILNKYTCYTNDQWSLNITRDDAFDLGVSNEVYDITKESIISVNQFICTYINNIDKSYNNTNLPISIPLIKTKTEQSLSPYKYDENGVPIPNPAIEINIAVSFGDWPETTIFTGPYKISATVSITSMGVWAYTVKDEIYNMNILATGNGWGTTSNRHDLEYPLVNSDGKCVWRLNSQYGGAANSRAEVLYKHNVNYGDE